MCANETIITDFDTSINIRFSIDNFGDAIVMGYKANMITNGYIIANLNQIRFTSENIGVNSAISTKFHPPLRKKSFTIFLSL